MGTISIDYGWLSDSANKLKSGATACRRYSERLSDRCQNKLSAIEGGLSGRVWDAYADISVKRGELDDKADRLDTLSAAVTRLRDYAKDQDEAVCRDIENRASEFQAANGMECSWIESAWAWLCDGVRSLLNATELGRLIADAFRKAGDWLADKWRRLRAWMDYEGGKFLVNIGLAVLAIAAAVVTILTAGAGVLAAISVVGAVIAILNGAVKIVQNIQSLSTYKDSPYAAEKAATIDTLSDLIRDKAEGIDNDFLRGAANFAAGTIDVVDGFCAIVGLADSATKAYETFTGKQTMFQKYLGQGGEIDSLFTKNASRTHGRRYDPVQNKWFQKDDAGKWTELDFSSRKDSRGMKLSIKTGLKNLKSSAMKRTVIDGTKVPRVTGFDMLKTQFVDDWNNIKKNGGQAFNNVANQFRNFLHNGKGSFRYIADSFGDLVSTGSTDRKPLSVLGSYISSPVYNFKEWTGINKVGDFFDGLSNIKQALASGKKDWVDVACDTVKTINTIKSIPENTEKYFAGDWHTFGDIGAFNKLLDKISGDRWKDWCAGIRQSIWDLGRPEPAAAAGTGGGSGAGGMGGGGGGFTRFAPVF